MKQTVLQIIEERFSGLSKGKQQIATYILNHLNEASFQTAAQIGKIVSVSESSVVRFAADMGYKGFPDFQKALQGVVMEQLHSSACAEEFNDSSIQSSAQILVQPFQPNKEDLAVLDLITTEFQNRNRLHLFAFDIGQFILPYCKLCAESVFDTVYSSSGTLEELFTGLSRISDGDAVLFLAIGEQSSLMSFLLSRVAIYDLPVVLLADSPLPDAVSFADYLLKTEPLSRGELPNLSYATALIYFLFSQLKAKVKGRALIQEESIKEIWDAYERYERETI